MGWWEGMVGRDDKSIGKGRGDEVETASMLATRLVAQASMASRREGAWRGRESPDWTFSL